jgi:hypothetical protein
MRDECLGLRGESSVFVLSFALEDSGALSLNLGSRG